MNSFQKLFDVQKALFASNTTRAYEWRIEQFDGMRRMINENEERSSESDGARY